MTFPISGVILAAGFSSRMNAFKPLLKVGEKTMIQAAIDLFKVNGIFDIIVVTGHNRQRLEPAIRRCGACPAFHPGFASGMLGSIQKGIQHIHPGHAGFFLLPTDIPAIRPSTVQQMISEFNADPHRIIMPCFKGQPGHPPLIPCNLTPQILALGKNATLRDLLASKKKQTVNLGLHDRGILMDADDPAGYQRVLDKIRHLDIPDKEECLSIIDQELPEEHPIRTHLSDVAMTALKLAHAVTDPVNMDLVVAAALLHDIKRMEKNHAHAGAILIQNLGFSKVSAVISQHMDIELDLQAPVQEKELVYFADKLCTRYGLDFDYHHRFRNRLDKHPRAATNIWKRYENTQLIQARIEASAGKSITEILTD
jgi:molybdenum cofactor cytidylyltransferase